MLGCDPREAVDAEADVVLMGYNLISMLEGESRRLGAFSSAFKTLKSKGFLVIENFLPTMLDSQMGGTDDRVLQVSLNDSDWLIRYKLDRSTSRLSTSYYQDLGDQVVLRRVDAHVLGLDEILLEVKSAGFRIEACFSDWSGTLMQQTSDSVILVAQKDG